jgi:hypothetical protein
VLGQHYISHRDAGTFKLVPSEERGLPSPHSLRETLLRSIGDREGKLDCLFLGLPREKGQSCKCLSQELRIASYEIHDWLGNYLRSQLVLVSLLFCCKLSCELFKRILEGIHLSLRSLEINPEHPTELIGMFVLHYEPWRTPAAATGLSREPNLIRLWKQFLERGDVVLVS